MSGANPNRRDHGRGLCAEEWARFCGRVNCADAIAKYIHSKKYFFKKTFFLSREKWSSEPDLVGSRKSRGDDKARGNWISRHLSIKRKKRPGSAREPGSSTPKYSETSRSGSAPELICPSPEPERRSGANFRRPSCFEGVVPVNFTPKLKVSQEQGQGIAAIQEEVQKIDLPKIYETDFDSNSGPKDVG